MEEDREGAEHFGEVMLQAIDRTVSGGFERHRAATVEAITEDIARRLEMAHVPEAVSLLDIAIRRDELAAAEAALRDSGDPAAVQARSAMLAADDLLRRFSNAIVEHARAAGAIAATGVFAAVLHVLIEPDGTQAAFAALASAFC